jgi:hypothetical protein
MHARAVLAAAGDNTEQTTCVSCCRHSAMVQLSVLLCLIPLALENAMMQAHITQVCYLCTAHGAHGCQGALGCSFSELILVA